jgi:hypothetical protein
VIAPKAVKGDYMTNNHNHLNRYGESHIKPASATSPTTPSFEDEYGMTREESAENIDWSHDPRSESSTETHYGKGPKSWVPDESIKKKASLALFLNPNVDAREIEISVKNGCVFLKGLIRNRAQKKSAESCVEYLPGVEDVFNELVIKQFHTKPRYKV